MCDGESERLKKKTQSCNCFQKRSCTSLIDCSLLRENTCYSTRFWRGSSTASTFRAEQRAIKMMSIAHLPIYHLSKVLKTHLSKDNRRSTIGEHLLCRMCACRSPHSGPISVYSRACSDKEFIKCLTSRQMLRNYRHFLLDILLIVCLSAHV